MEGAERYLILENVIQCINSKFISTPEAEMRRNNCLLKVVDKIVSEMKDMDVLFKKLYERIYYGGSYYDKLKVGKPSEYDLDCLLRLPKLLKSKVDISDKPGFVHVDVGNMELLLQQPGGDVYRSLKELVDDSNRLSTRKVLYWIEGLINKALNKYRKNNIKNPALLDFSFEDNKYTVEASLTKGGPAQTLKITGEINGQKVDVDIDLVICFVFTKEKWPSNGGYTANPLRESNANNKTSFFVVPKSPKHDPGEYWRLSFQEQEKELMKGHQKMKPIIRLFKKMRDRYSHQIASYFIKTIFLWELKNREPEFWQKQLGFIFASMLEVYISCMREREIRYYWNPNFNLIHDLKPETCDSIAGCLQNILNKVNRSLPEDPFTVAECLLTKEEVDVVKKDVQLGKKHLKKRDASLTPAEAPAQELTPSSSLEEITTENESNEEQSPKILDAYELLLSSSLKSMFQSFEGGVFNRIAEMEAKIVARLNKVEGELNDLLNERRLTVANEEQSPKILDAYELLLSSSLKPMFQSFEGGVFNRIAEMEAIIVARLNKVEGELNDLLNERRLTVAQQALPEIFGDRLRLTD